MLVLIHTASSFTQYEIRQVHRLDFDHLGITGVNRNTAGKILLEMSSL